jgi:long-subunit acyl-CoA synthetase (AMP-forming)
MRVAEGAHIGIMSHSRLEWAVVQNACDGFGFVPTRAYDTFGWDKVNDIIDWAQIKVLFVVSTKVESRKICTWPLDYDVVHVSKCTRLLNGKIYVQKAFLIAV